MAYDGSIPELVAGALSDAQELIRQELLIARTEIRDEVARLKAAATAFAGAAAVGWFAIGFLLLALAFGIADGLGWPAWAGLLTVGVILAIVAAVLGMVGRGRLATERHMARTIDTMKENAEWLKARTQQ